MAFLRIQRGVVRGKHKRNTVQVDAAWVADGKMFVNKKRAGEYLWRKLTNTLVDGLKPSGFDSRTVSKPTGHDPRLVQKTRANMVRRVYSHQGFWRVTVAEIWQSDHTSMEDALLGVNPIGVEPEAVSAGVVFVPQ